MADPYVGKLTYFRVYSGKLEAGSRVLNVNTGQTERIGRILMMHANDREDVTEVYAGDIAAAVGIKQVVTGDTLAAPDKPIMLETMDVPRPGHLRGDRAEDEVRPGEDVRRPRPPGRGGPDLPGPDERGDRPDRDLGHGRAAPRDPGRPHDARVQGRGQRRPPAGLLPRDGQGHGQEGRGPPRPPDRRLGPVRHRLHRHRAGAGRGLRLRQQDQGRLDPDGVHPGGREGRRGGAGDRRARRLPAGRRPRHARRTASSTTRTRRRSRSRSPARWRSRRRASGPSRSCSSRSSRSRSSRPRTTWATSSATSTVAVGA